MNLLDCETPESVKGSLCDLLGLTHDKLHKGIEELLGLELDPTKNRHRQMLCNVVGRDLTDDLPGKTCWFHATRVQDPNSFTSGIDTLQSRLEITWSFLRTLVADCVSQTDWALFRREVEKNHYGQSCMVIKAWLAKPGPHAFLLADAPLTVFGPSRHDYLRHSELVDFIADYFDRTHSVSLIARHLAATKPFLVKFTTPGICTIHLGAALDYLVHRKSGWSLDSVSPCFSGKGTGIPGERIKRVIRVGEYRDCDGKNPKYWIAG